MRALKRNKYIFWEWRTESIEISILLRIENGDGGTYTPGNPFFIVIPEEPLAGKLTKAQWTFTDEVI